MDDYRLAPILDDAALFGQQGQDILSLDLPPIQDSGLTRSHANELLHEPPLTPQHVRDVPALDSTPPSARKTQSHDAQQHYSTLPLARVLNDEQSSSPHGRETGHKPQGYDSRLNEVDVTPPQMLQLPQPNVQHSVDNPQFLPPLLQGLHDPPPDAGLFPRITGDDAQGNLATTTRSLRPRAQAQGIRRVSNSPEPEPERPIVREPRKTPEAKQATPAKNDSQSKTTSTGRRNKKWSKEETLILLKGVKKHGVGSWKQILADSALGDLSNRTPVDLKDRYRVCRTRSNAPSKNNNSTPTNSATPTHRTTPANEPVKRHPKRTDAKSKPTHHDLTLQDLSPVLIDKSSHRRERHPWSAAEDAAIVAGREKHGDRWAEIIKDPALVLRGRTRNDVRDRWRTVCKRRGKGSKRREETGGVEEGEGGAREEVRKQGSERDAGFVDPSETWGGG